MHRRASGLVVTALMACRPGPEPAPAGAPAVPVEPRVTAEEAPAVPTPEILDRTVGSTPSWLSPERPEFSVWENHPTSQARVVAIGQSAALVRATGARRRLFKVDTLDGVSDPVSVPSDASWVGLDARDRITYAAGGAIHRLEPGGQVTTLGRPTPGTSHWMGRGDVLVGRHGADLVVSTDGGVTFATQTPPFPPAVLRVRSDGVLAIADAERDPTRVEVSPDAGRTWRGVPLPFEELAQVGGWIWNGSYRCPAVLSADPKRWAKVDDAALNRSFNLFSWVGEVQPDERASGVRMGVPHETVDTPAVPPKPTGKHWRKKACPPPKKTGGVPGGVPGGVLGGLVGRGVACEGVACVRGAPVGSPVASTTHYSFARDGQCSAGHSDVHGFCTAQAPFTRAPHLMVADLDTGDVGLSEVPPSCAPRRVIDARGMGVLMCADGQLWTASDASGAWVNEGKIPATVVWARTVAEDGTLLLHHTCPRDRDCVASVRQPVEVGDASPWRTVAIPGAQSYRVVEGGRVLAVVQSAPDAPERMSLVLNGPGGDEVLVPEIRLPGKLQGVEVTEGGRVRLSLRDDRGASRMDVMPNGRLVAAPASVVQRDPRTGVVTVRAQAVDPAWGK